MTFGSSHAVILFGNRLLTVEDVLRLARGEARPAIDPDPEVLRRIRASAQAVERHLAARERIYGVTTGFGDSCETSIDPEFGLALSANLVRFHGCGTGHPLGDEEAAAVIAVRLAALVRGYSGVREILLERLCELLTSRVLPVIPEEGSVGASGDLTPLSYLAALIMGEREARVDGVVLPALEALARAGMEPLPLGPKEGLALMNGTSVMTALGCIAFDRARALARAAANVSAMMVDALQGEPAHFDPRIFDAKPHPGQALCARWIREHLGLGGTNPGRPERIQDRYSLRCAPHVIGVLLDALPSIRSTLEVELNGAGDNPLIDPETGDILHGGNFYGGHVAYAMDGLKAAVASIADLLDRQLALACNPATNNGLPANLVMRGGAEGATHHGFKAMQIASSALTAEALKLTMPAASFSRSTECHNQDKVSMGTIAARDALRVGELTERVLAITLLAACQALDIRGAGACRPRSREILEAVRRSVPKNVADRRQDVDIAAVIDRFRRSDLAMGSPEEP